MCMHPQTIEYRNKKRDHLKTKEEEDFELSNDRLVTLYITIDGGLYIIYYKIYIIYYIYRGNILYMPS